MFYSNILKIKREPVLDSLLVLLKKNYYLNAEKPVTSIPVISKWISCVPS